MKLLTSILFSISLSVYGQFGSFNDQAFLSQAGGSLRNNLVHYYQLNDASCCGNNAFADSVGSQTLSGLNSGSGISLVTGHVQSQAVQSANNGNSCDGISSVGNVGLDFTGDGTGNTSMSYCCWFNMVAFASQTFKPAFGAPIVGIIGGTAAVQSFILRQTAASQIQFVGVIQGGASSASVTISSVTDAQWHLAVFGFDQPNGQIWMSIDNGAKQTASLASFNSFGTQPLTVMQWGAACNQTFGIVSDFGVWNNRILSTSDIAALWNSGNGKPFSQF